MLMVWNPPKNPVKCRSLDFQSFVFSSSGVAVVEFMVILVFFFFFFGGLRSSVFRRFYKFFSLC